MVKEQTKKAKAWSIPRGMRSTVDTERYVEPEDRKKKPEKKLSDLEKGLEEIQGRLSEIQSEREKHLDAQSEARAEREKLKASFAELQDERKQKVNELLEDNFLSQGEKGLVNAVLTTTIKEPRLQQLQDSIAKLEAQEMWHQRKLAELARETKALEKKKHDLNADDAALAAYYEYETFKDLYFAAESAYELFKAKILHAKGFDNKFTDRLAKKGIRDQCFVNIIDSRLRNDTITTKTMAELADELSLIHTLKDNPWGDASTASRRRIYREIDPRTNTYSNNVRIGAI